jgi:hypothetical protein
MASSPERIGTTSRLRAPATRRTWLGSRARSVTAWLRRSRRARPNSPASRGWEAQPSAGTASAAAAAISICPDSGSTSPISTAEAGRASRMRATAVCRMRPRDRLPAISRTSELTSASCSLRSRSRVKATELAAAIESWLAKRVRYSRSSSVKGRPPAWRVAFSTPKTATRRCSWSK